MPFNCCQRKSIAASGGIKSTEDEYNTKDNRSTRVEIWQSAAIAAMQC